MIIRGSDLISDFGKGEKFFLIWELEIGVKVKLVLLALALAFALFCYFPRFQTRQGNYDNLFYFYMNAPEVLSFAFTCYLMLCLLGLLSLNQIKRVGEL